MSTINNITKRVIREETLHNLEVKDDESYIANGIVVHNTNFMPQHSIKSRILDPNRRKDDKAETLYTSFSRRMKSRFLEMGRMPGKLFLISSASLPNAFLERRVAEAKNDPL